MVIAIAPTMDSTAIMSSSSSSQQSSMVNTYLSILPANGPTTVSRDAPIYTTESKESRPSLRATKSASFSNVFENISSSKPSTAKTNNGLTIRLADQDVLLPFIDREKEVGELLRTTRSGVTLQTRLQGLYDKHAASNGSTEWQLISELLFKTSRTAMSDRPWLVQLRGIIMRRSPRLWCNLLEVLGAHEINLDERRSGDEDEQRGMQDDDPIVEEPMFPASPLFGDDAPLSIDTSLRDQPPPASFEVLTSVPPSFARSPKTVAGVSVRNEDVIALQRADNSTDGGGIDVTNCEETEANRVLNSRKNGFAGLRVRLPSLSSATSSAHSSSASRSGSFSSSPDVSFASHRRLSQLFMTPFAAVSADGGDSPSRADRHTLPRHQRQRSQPESLASLSSSSWQRPAMTEKRPSFSSTWSEIQTRQRDRSRTSVAATTATESSTAKNVDSLSPKFLARKRSRTVANVNAASTSTWPRNSGGEAGKPLSQSFLESGIPGLLPDGRTRHPSASSSDADSKAAIAAFRDSMRLSSPANEDASVGSGGSGGHRDSISASGSEAEAEIRRGDIRSPRAKDATAVSSTTTRRKSDEGSDRTANTNPSSLIFPIPPNPQYSRPQELFTLLDEAANDRTSSWNFLLAAIGAEGIEHVRKTISRSGERTTCSDEKLVTRIAANCFGMVDMDLVTSGYTVHQPQATLDDRLQSKPWHVHRQSRRPGGVKHASSRASALTHDSSRHVENEDDDDDEETESRKRTPQADVDHEARLQAYYDDVEGYEERFTAFDMLLRNVWNVENDVLSVVRQRCGPATRLGSSNWDRTGEKDLRTKMTTT